MLKYSHFLGETEQGITTIPLFGPADSTFEKTAAPSLLPEVAEYIAGLQAREDAQYVLVNALGAGEYYSSNINGDHFPEAALIHKPDDWANNPLIDRPRSRTWAYGFPTFYMAHPFAHHRNKDPKRAFGEIELAAWNPLMKRVELICRVDRDKCYKFGGVPVWDKLTSGQFPDVSMGTKVPYDTCSTCLDWDLYNKALLTYNAKRHKHPGAAVLEYHKKLKARTGKGITGLSVTRADYCEHARKQMNKILPDGRKVFVYNDFPRFFDISFVFIGADKIAKVMMYISRRVKPSVVVAEELGVTEKGLRNTKTLFDGAKNASWAVQSSSISGDGVFTTTPQKGGTSLGVAFKRTGKKGPPDVALSRTSLGAKTNHSASPNSQLVRSGSDYVVRLMKDVPNGAEVTLDYENIPWEGKRGFDGKTASIEDILLKQAFGKLAKPKLGEIKKRVVPSQFAGKAVPLLTKAEPDIPKHLLRLLSSHGLPKALSTTAGMGMLLRPREFQRIIMTRLGREDEADELDDAGVVFPRVEDSEPSCMGPGMFSPSLARLLLPLLASRSALAPAIERRVVVLVDLSGEKEKSPSSHKSKLLHKIGAAYNGYRSGALELVAHSQSLSDQVGTGELSKLSSANIEDILTPLSVQYLHTAYWDEVGQVARTGLRPAWRGATP